ncbi:MAG: signal peptidase II [Alphaproteobacteria bacterium]|jgi:signal peptidase II|nr:signal peptidase II [Alphaproteobacteria bacterium]
MLRFGLRIAAAVILLDQATKWLVLEVVMAPPRSIPVTDFFNIVMVWNRGVSFGLFDNDSMWTPVLLSLLAVGITIVLMVWLRRAEGRWLALGLGMVIGGAVGNVIDRAVWRAVFDFLDFHVAGYHWPAFNVADSAITVGVVLILAEGLFAKDRKPM